jgi:hypothetical protein
MRRALLTLTAGMFLAAVGACGTAAESPSASVGTLPAAAPAATGAGQPVHAGTKASCEALGQVFSTNIGPFAEALSKMVAASSAPDAAKPAQQKLSAFASAIRDATRASAEAPMRTSGEQTAKQLQAKSADQKFFRGIRTAADVETVLGTDLKQWLTPVTKLCS